MRSVLLLSHEHEPEFSGGSVNGNVMGFQSIQQILVGSREEDGVGSGFTEIKTYAEWHLFWTGCPGQIGPGVRTAWAYLISEYLSLRPSPIH
jgi:hypothetical protein